MLRKLSDFKGFLVYANDDKLGNVEDFYFDQDHFVFRYLVINTGKWLQNQENIISTNEITKIDFDSRKITVDLTKSEIEKSPTLDQNKPISKIKEKELIEFFGWPNYWVKDHSSESELIHAGTRERKKLLSFKALKDDKKQDPEEIESNLRSLDELIGYKIHAQDEKFGHLEDIIVEENKWLIRYLLIDTKNILAGDRVLIAPEWIQSISWQKNEIFINKDKKEIENAPKYKMKKSDDLVHRNYEETLYDHYNEEKYWD